MEKQEDEYQVERAEEEEEEDDYIYIAYRRRARG